MQYNCMPSGGSAKELHPPRAKLSSLGPKGPWDDNIARGGCNSFALPPEGTQLYCICFIYLNKKQEISISLHSRGGQFHYINSLHPCFMLWNSISYHKAGGQFYCTPALWYEIDFTENFLKIFHKAGVAKQIAPPLNSLNKVNAIEIANPSAFSISSLGLKPSG